tara:strand:- start:24 stop:941 length:918 start_codon:yes stop_codon:yes gene_type:complete
MSRIFVFNHPIFLSGSHGMSSSPTTAITNRANITASIFTDQDISTTGTPIFYESNFSGSIDVADGKWTIQKVGDSVTITPSGSFDVTGSLGVSNGFTVQKDMFVDGILKGKDFITELETASVIFPSGSTKFGDSTDDKHPFSGSLLIGNDMSRSIDLTIPHTGSGVPVVYNITEFRNEPFPSGSFEQTQPITEYAGVNLIAPFSANQRYNRKCFAKKAISITTDVATFNAESASAPRSEDETLFEQLPVTDENDFMFFRNGMVMEQDALSIQQSGSLFLLTINSNGLGYELETTDEIIAWGKFNS